MARTPLLVGYHRLRPEELPGHQLRAGDVIRLSEWSADEAKQKENQK